MPKTAYIVESDYNNDWSATVSNVLGMPPGLMFTYGGARFIAFHRQDEPFNPNTSYISVYRSTDGQNWTRYDGPSRTGSPGGWFGSVSLDPITNTLWFSMLPVSASQAAFQLVSFNLTTFAFSAIIGSGPTGESNSNGHAIQAYNGTVYLFFQRSAGSPTFAQQLYRDSCTAGVWAGETFIENVAANCFRGIGINPATGVIGISYRATSPFPIRFRSFSAGVLSAACDLAGANSSADAGGKMAYIPSQDAFALAVAPSPFDADSGKILVMTATPSLNPVTAALELAGTAAATFCYRNAQVVVEGSNLTVITELYSTGAVTTALKEVAFSRLAAGGAWGAETTLFDRLADSYSPIPSGASNSHARGLLAESSTVLSFEAGIPGGISNQYALAPAAFTLACPSSAAVLGSAYSGFLVPTGGTGPFTYAITAGALPTGLTLNAATGEISGIPTALGTFSYTAQVTDSLGATATTTCSITVGGRGLTRGMSILTAKQFSELREKGISGTMPTDIYLDHEFPNAGFHVWPVPNTAHDIEFYYWAVLPSFGAVGDSMVLPEGYYDALVYALAMALAASYRRKLSAPVVALAKASKKMIQDINAQILTGSYHSARTLAGPNEGELQAPMLNGGPEQKLLPGAREDGK